MKLIQLTDTETKQLSKNSCSLINYIRTEPYIKKYMSILGFANKLLKSSLVIRRDHLAKLIGFTHNYRVMLEGMHYVWGIRYEFAASGVSQGLQSANFIVYYSNLGLTIEAENSVSQEIVEQFILDLSEIVKC